MRLGCSGLGLRNRDSELGNETGAAGLGTQVRGGARDNGLGTRDSGRQDCKRQNCKNRDLTATILVHNNTVPEECCCNSSGVVGIQDGNGGDTRRQCWRNSKMMGTQDGNGGGGNKSADQRRDGETKVCPVGMY